MINDLKYTIHVTDGAGLPTEMRQPVSDELKAQTFFAESIHIESTPGRIVPSPSLAEAVIGGLAQIIAERDELRVFKASVPWSTLNHCELILTSSNRLIESVDTQNRADEMRCWLDANAPKGERLTTEQLEALVELIRKA